MTICAVITCPNNTITSGVTKDGISFHRLSKSETSMFVIGPKIWNALGKSIKDAISDGIFASKLKEFLVGKAYYSLGAGGLRAAELRITPRVVHKGRDVTMACLYELQDSGIYSVKWYKGSSEFYRYSPLETPNTRVTQVPGVHVDMSRSNATQAVLVAAALSLSGNFSCEVILHAPFFPNFVASARLDVIGAGGLRATELQISPPIVQRGSDAILICLYQLHDAPLYSVKWYRGRHEFYRYSPTEVPDTKIFPFAGINVDLARSNESQVVLTRVSFGLSGNFSCEVTADAPSFATSIVSNQMEVVVLPAWPPRVQTERVNYSPGDVLLANCSSPPSRPLAALTFYINEVTIRPGQLRVQQAGEGLSWAELSIAIQLLPAHYERGAPVLRCEAVVTDLYSEGTQIALYPANGDPKIERVTSPGSGASSLIAANILIIITITYVSRKINN